MNYNPFSLEGKKILVTGASSGIGSAIAIECSKLGATVFLLGRNIERLSTTFEKLEGVHHEMFSVDLTNSQEVNTITEILPEINGVVHAAGINQKMPLKFLNEEMVHDIFNTNVFSSLYFTKHLIKKKKLLKESSIVFISSISSHYASIGNITYMASKGAVKAMSRGLALELSRQLIRVNSIEPGMVLTNLTKDYTDEVINQDLKNYPLGRYGKPSEIAFAAIYLLSDASNWVTGTSITIDGGVTLR